MRIVLLLRVMHRASPTLSRHDQGFCIACSAQRKALVSVVFRSAKAYGVAGFSGLTLVGTVLDWNGHVVMRSSEVSNGVDADSAARLCFRGGDGAVREVPMHQATDDLFRDVLAVAEVSVVLRAASLLGQLLGLDNVRPCHLRVTSRTGAPV